MKLPQMDVPCGRRNSPHPDPSPNPMNRVEDCDTVPLDPGGGVGVVGAEE